MFDLSVGEKCGIVELLRCAVPAKLDESPAEDGGICEGCSLEFRTLGLSSGAHTRNTALNRHCCKLRIAIEDIA